MTRVLDVWLHDSKAGYLRQSADAALEFAYAGEYLANAASHAISVSMPLREEPYSDSIARPFFSGLLPDERARRQLASALGISEGNAFGLLEIIGGECAGALSLLPSGKPPEVADEHAPEPLTRQRLAELLDLLRSRPLLGGQAGVRLSLAGAQDKLAVCLIDGEIALARPGYPTTHILKPFIEGLAGSVENEIYCMRLAARAGFPVPPVSKGSVKGIDYYLVERYDRQKTADGATHRLHQEDFCQALSVPPELKYEEEGGPGIEAAQSLIARHARRPAADRLRFLRMVMFQYLVGNADAHAKNHALLHRDKTPDLAPLYDVICTAAYPSLSRKMAMRIGGRGLADTIHRKHWQTLVPDTRVAKRLLFRELQDLSETVAEVSTPLLREMQDEGTGHQILDKVLDVIGTRVRHVRTALSQVAD